MAREHLFRGFHERADGDTVITLNDKRIKGSWVVGYYCFLKARRGACGQTVNKLDFDSYYIVTFRGKSFDIVPTTNCEQLLYPDKKGNKVFESDIVKRDGAPLNLIVKFNEILMRYCLNYYDSQREQEYFVCFLDKDEFEKIEVIGNAFENFELLEEKL